MTSEDRKITVWGPGTEGRDLLYVGDLVDFVEKALKQQNQPFELVNVGYGTALQIKELVQMSITISPNRKTRPVAILSAP